MTSLDTNICFTFYFLFSFSDIHGGLLQGKGRRGPKFFIYFYITFHVLPNMFSHLWVALSTEFNVSEYGIACKER